VLENYFESAKDFKEAELHIELDQASNFNKFLALGLHSFKNGDFDISLEYFKRA